MPPRWKSARMRAPSAWLALPVAGRSMGSVNLSDCASTGSAQPAASANNKARWNTGLGRLGLLGIARRRGCGLRARGGQRGRRGARRDGRGVHGRELVVASRMVLGLVNVGQVEGEAENEEDDRALDGRAAEDVVGFRT